MSGTEVTSRARAKTARNNLVSARRVLAEQRNGPPDTGAESSRTVSRRKFEQVSKSLKDKENDLGALKSVAAKAKIETKSARQSASIARNDLAASREASEGFQQQVEDLHRYVQTLEERCTRQQEQLDSAHDQIRILRKEVKAGRERERRAKESRGRVIATQLMTARTVQLKKGRSVPDRIRLLVMALVCNVGLAQESVPRAFEIFCDHLDLRLVGSISSRTVANILAEGDVLSQMQLGDELRTAEGEFPLNNYWVDTNSRRSGRVPAIYWSADNTMHRSIQFNSQFVTHTQPDGSHKSSFVAVNTVPDHSVQTQTQIWLESVGKMAAALNDSPRGKTAGLLFSRLYEHTKGFHADHASDCKAFAARLQTMCRDADRYERGKAALHQLSQSDNGAYAQLVIDSASSMIENLGGVEVWEAKSAKEKEEHWARMYADLATERGETEFAKLSPEEQADIDEFIYVGCCMHKDLNAAVYAHKALVELYDRDPLVSRPVKLANKDNAAAIQAGPSAARDRAEAVSVGGGVKCVQLTAKVANDKDENKGYHDLFKAFVEREYGYGVVITFPNATATRFQSLLEGAAFIMRHLNLLQRFLIFARDSKETMSLTHLEQNVQLALDDGPTLTELAAMALYLFAVSHPYCRRIRSDDVNALELGPLHEATAFHCAAVAADPDLILAHDASPSTACLWGDDWRDPQCVAAIRKLQEDEKLPGLRKVVSAYFSGAEKGWLRFSQEYESGGQIDSMPREKRAVRFVPATNDRNEGALGRYKVFKRSRPNASVAYFNAVTRIKLNGTDKYAEQLSPADFAYARKTARSNSKARSKRRENDLVIAARQNKVKLHREKQAARGRKQAADNALLDVIGSRRFRQPEEVLPETKVKRLDEELKWHRRRGVPKAVPQVKEMKGKEAKIAALKIAITRYNDANMCSDTDEDGEWCFATFDRF